VIGGGSWKRARWGTDTPAGERERHTHLRQWGQHGAAGWLYLVAVGEWVGSPRSCGRAAGARMWSPLPRRCLHLQHGRRHPRSSQAGSRQRQHTASALATSAPSSGPSDTLTASEAHPRRPEEWSRVPTSRPLRSILGCGRPGSAPRRPSHPALLPQQRLPSTVRATMGSLPRVRICINMQSCPCTFCACDVTSPLFLSSLLLKMRKACADRSRYSAASEQGGGRLKVLRDRPNEPSGQYRCGMPRVVVLLCAGGVAHPWLRSISAGTC